MRLDVFGGIAANQSTLHGHAQNSQINDVQTIISPVPENHLGLETIEPKSPAETSWGASSISPQLLRNCSATSTQLLQDFPVSSVAFSLRTTTATFIQAHECAHMFDRAYDQELVEVHQHAQGP